MTEGALSTVGGRIKWLRTAKEMTQWDLARRVMASQSAVARWERNERRPGAPSQRLLADALGVTRSFLMGDD